MIIWYLPFYYPARNDVGAAWVIAASFAGISFGWAAGDVSLAAYIQAALTREEKEDDDVSALGSVMSFLCVPRRCDRTTLTLPATHPTSYVVLECGLDRR